MPAKSKEQQMAAGAALAKAFEVVTERAIAQNGKLDEHTPAPQAGEDQAEETAA